MELIVNNLGRIKEARLDIKPLTVFVGPNNTNKTWTAYALYGLACRLTRNHFSTRLLLALEPSAGLKATIERTVDQLHQFLTRNDDSKVTRRIDREQMIRGFPGVDLVFSLGVQALSPLLGVPVSTAFSDNDSAHD